MSLDRRHFLGAAAGGLLGATALPELIDRLAGAAPARAAAAAVPHVEQHLLDGVTLIRQDGVEVLVPPLHHAIVTARVRATDLAAARRDLEDALRSLEARYPPTPAGLGITVAWGLPYFRKHVAAAARAHLPFDRRARKPALLDARRFPSDPKATLLEQNDVVVLLRSDHVAHVRDAERSLFDRLDVFERTSVRHGFVGGGFKEGPGLPKLLAQRAGVPGADLIPDGAELFLGFTSTQKAALGPSKIANHETLGYVDLRRSGYFHGGTHMHLSHIHEDLEAWYLGLDFAERVTTMFKPGLDVKVGTQAVGQGPRAVSSAAALARSASVHGRFGHSASIQPTSRLQQDVVGPDGTRYPKGTAIPQRADFNSLDNPFAWSATPKRDGLAQDASASLHFVSFNPSSDDFHRNRLAMDGVMPGGKRLPTSGQYSRGFNEILRTTHRQNFLVPPRRHRSFPLSEL
ncbi:MAG: hypothetical protein QOE29_1903 [Gaiellaceae bacterium]|nr:hypothetical protein [Gaiellaceae bacterium]